MSAVPHAPASEDFAVNSLDIELRKHVLEGLIDEFKCTRDIIGKKIEDKSGLQADYEQLKEASTPLFNNVDKCNAMGEGKERTTYVPRII